MFGKTNWVLKGIRGAHAHAIYVLEESVSLGRSADADIQVLDRRVSRQHARIVVTPDEVLLEDLGSQNGTFVHGHKVVRRPLRAGDKLSIGVSEYVIDQLDGRILTSAIFLKKLSTDDTLGGTAAKQRVAKEILASPTMEMPVQRATQELGTVQAPDRPSERQSERPRRPEPARQEAPSGRAEPVGSPEPAGSEPAYVREQRERAVHLPSPMPGELEWSLGPEAPAQSVAASAPDPQIAAAPPLHLAPPLAEAAPTLDAPPIAEPLLAPLGQELSIATEPLNPRSHRMDAPAPSPVPRESPVPIAVARASALPTAPLPAAPSPTAPAPDPTEDIGNEAALRTIDAVVRLLKLRMKESGGALLKIQDRENLRRLEGVLREPRRNKANRRRWTRLPCQFAASIGEDGAETGDARVTNIGAGGLGISGDLSVEPGDLICIRVRLGEGRLARVAIFRTKVVWVNAETHAFGALFHGPAQWELAG